MSKAHSIDKVTIGVGTTMEPVVSKPESGSPFRVAIMGDFSGRSNQGRLDAGTAIGARRPVMVDRDNFDEILARHEVELRLKLEGEEANQVVLQFGCLDDFHPDRIFQSVELFQSLRAIRSRLNNPATFAAAAAEVRSWAQWSPAPPSPPVAPQPVAEPQTERSALSVEGLFDQVLDESQAQPRRVAGGIDWRAMAREIAAPYSLPGTDPQLPQLVGCVDGAITALMRAIMHHPDFQAIEAAWRALYFLVRRVETDAELKLYLIDISKAELARDLGSSDNLCETGLYKVLVEQTVGTPGGQLWTVLLGNFTFDQTRQDAELFARVGVLAQQAGAPFLAEAHPHMVDCESLAKTPDPRDWVRAGESKAAEAWTFLRSTQIASYLGLVLPRFLLRLPYGKKTEPTERFDFEELAHGAPHQSYLWGNSAFACTTLLAQAFAQQGWDLRPNSVLELDGLPAHVYQSDDESEMKPCAEVLLVERAIERIAGQGIMPLLSIKGRDNVRLASFFCIAGPGQPLAGRWERQ